MIYCRCRECGAEFIEVRRTVEMDDGFTVTVRHSCPFCDTTNFDYIEEEQSNVSGRKETD